MRYRSTKTGGNYARNAACLGAAMLAIGWLAAGEARGQSVWDAGAGDWMEPLNWADNMLPAGGDVVISNGGVASLSDGDVIQDLYLGVDGGETGQLQIIQSGTLSSRDGFIGRLGIGHLTLSGDPCAWTAEDIIVAGSSSGFLTLLSGADVTSLSGVVGESMGSNGVVIVDQTSTWDVGSEFEGVLTVGAGGEGDLTIDGQGSVTSGSGVLAANAMSDGAVIVRTNSTWTNEGDLTIGGLGAATLLVQGGSDVSNENAFIANGGGTSSVTVTGEGSTWTSGGRLDVGVSGIGSLMVSGGGDVVSEFTLIPEDIASAVGRNAGSVGTVTVTVEGSKWTAGFLDVGVLGKGTLNITSGGDVDAEITIAAEPTLMGTPPVSEVNVMGNGSTLTGAGLIVGGGGEAELNINTGGKVMLDGFGGLTIGNEAGSKGVVTIDASGSELTMGGSLSVGWFGHGELHLSNHAAVTSESGVVGTNEGSTGVATIASESTWTMSLGMGISGSMTIEGGGKVFNSGTSEFDRNSISGYGEEVAEVIVNHAGSKWQSTVIGLDVGGFDGAGSLRIINGGEVSNGHGVVARGEAGGTVHVEGLGSKWTNDGILFVGLGGAGTMNVLHSGVVRSEIGRIGSALEGSSGAVTVNGIGAKWEMTDTLEIGFNGGTGSLTIVNSGSVVAPGGTTIGENGTLAGTGTLTSTVTNNGVVAPGASPGTLSVTGGYVQGSDGKLAIEIASAVSFDKLQVTGSAFLDGELAIELLGSYVPTPGDAFNILMAGSRMGAFDSVTVTRNSLPAGSFTVGLTGTGVTLSNFMPAGGFAAADFTEDHIVNGADLTRWKSFFGTGTTHVEGNADGDGDADGADFLIWQRQLGTVLAQPTAAAVPEPAALPLALVASLAAFRGFRRSVPAAL